MVLTQQGIKLIRNFLGPSGGETPGQEVPGGRGVIHPSWGGHQHRGIIAPGVVWWRWVCVQVDSLVSNTRVESPLMACPKATTVPPPR